ncbi:hypothetical protein JG688_00017829, partial [Phytophthora aleatoria]
SDTGSLRSEWHESTEASHTHNHTILVAEDRCTTDVDVEIETPARPRGLPKQKSKTKKPAKSRTIEMAKTESIFHDKLLSLASIPDVLSNTATCASVAVVLKHFKTFALTKKARPPIARVIAKLPPTTTVLTPSEITRIPPSDLIKRSALKVTALQNKNMGIGERDAAIEFPVFGVLTMSVFLTMKLWHRAAKALDTIEKARKWTVSVNLKVVVPDFCHVEVDPDLTDKMEAIPLLSEKV